MQVCIWAAYTVSALLQSAGTGKSHSECAVQVQCLAKGNFKGMKTPFCHDNCKKNSKRVMGIITIHLKVLWCVLVLESHNLVQKCSFGQTCCSRILWSPSAWLNLLFAHVSKFFPSNFLCNSCCRNLWVGSKEGCSALLVQVSFLASMQQPCNGIVRLNCVPKMLPICFNTVKRIWEDVCKD